MERVQARMMVAMALIMVALGALVVLWDPAEEPFDPDATVPVWTVLYEDVVGVRLERVDEVIAIEKRDDGWTLTEPEPYRADPDAVHEIVDALRTVEMGVPMEGEPQDYGLEPPETTVTVTTRDGLEKTLAVGRASPVGYKTYVLGEEDVPVAVEGELFHALNKDALDIRDQRLFRFDVANVTQVVVQSPDGTLELSRGDDRAEWFLAGFTRADIDALEDLLLGLLDLRFDTFGDEMTEEIVEPTFMVEVQTEDGTVHQARFGEVTPMGAVTLLGDGTTGFVQAAPLALLGQGPTDVGDPGAFPFRPDRDETVEITLGEASGSWTREAGSDAVEAALSGATIHYRATPVPDLNETWGQVVVDGRTIAIGQVEGAYRVARDERGGEPYLIPQTDLQGLADALEGAEAPAEPAPEPG